jgi:type III restriction enzyme
MELKDYQQTALLLVKQFLELLDKERLSGNLKHASLDAWFALFPSRRYHERQTGTGKDLPNFCLKIPTGGGKTLLAVRTIELINSIYLKKRTGLVLWVVPTTQIYRQTINHLRNRDHPYRQFLDIASGGRTMILEKTDRFTPLDVRENLVVLMLMLPSAARQNKETLRMFKDSGAFPEFFPLEDDFEGHNKLLAQIPNLDTYGSGNGFWGRQIKTSLGNVLRLLSPIIILDEGHKAYSKTAQKTLEGFNPSIIVELSATPPKGSNIIVDIRGTDLNKEEMIKLDLHIINKASPDWKDTLLASKNHRDLLEQKAKEYEANTGIYIRPICLIQVERTGKDQRDGRHIHAEDVREYLVNVLGIPPQHVAIKTSEKDELKEVDDVGGLMAPDCPIRYIITKQALQEGWDCAFAYVLSILSNPASKTALTQLVGRILRQPYARKTKVKELDESYVFAFQRKGALLLEEIRRGFGHEGLGDLAGRIVADIDEETGLVAETERTHHVREKFNKAASQFILPVFVIKRGDGWAPVSYEMDIVSRIPWDQVNIEPIFDLRLSTQEEKDIEQIATISSDPDELIRQREARRLREGAWKLDSVFVARNLLDVIPNPWIAYEVSEQVLTELLKRNDVRLVINNFVFIVEELRKHLTNEKDRLAERVFRDLVEKEELKFLVIGNDLGFRFPKEIKVKPSERTLTKADGQPLQRSLFDFVSEDEFNDTERAVAWYLEEQDRLFFWYRNVDRRDYGIQGWRKNKVYPDFILTTLDNSTKTDFDKVFVVETKGLHLKGNPDTSYKKSLLDMCNEQAREENLSDLGLVFKNKTVHYEVVSEEEWQRRFNEMFVG